MTAQSAQLETLINDLCEKSYAICENFLPTDTIFALADDAKQHYLNGDLTAAKTGKINKTLNQEIRGDATLWLEENDSNASIQAYFSKMHTLKKAINEALFMNLHALETHLAIYPVGSTYQKHLDQFAHTENRRQISSILYLNEDWQAGDGGELRLYLEDKTHLDILPTGGKLVLFLSAKFWHEVLPAKRDRISLTGWFRTRENT